jgi:hypothetical protein
MIAAREMSAVAQVRRSVKEGCGGKPPRLFTSQGGALGLWL